MSAAYTSADPNALDDLYEGRATGYTYAREGHPNADVLAGMIDALEGRDGGIITGSGMSAVSAALLAVLKSGDHVVGGDQLYGRSLRLMAEDMPRLGIATTLADPTDVDAVSAAIQPNTKAILLEVVSNPTLRIADIEGIAALARANDLKLIVDNTFTTPAGFSPWTHGADIVVHSVTKILAGHTDVILGYVAARNPEVSERLSALITTWGLTPIPFDCWLAERGDLNFKSRFRQATENAGRLAQALSKSGDVPQVIYPGRADHHDGMRSDLLTSPGNMLSIRIDGGRDAAVRLTRAASSLAFAPTLGDVSTTLSHPASSSHRALSVDARSALGINEGFFRVSVGIEDPDVIISSLLDGVTAAKG